MKNTLLPKKMKRCSWGRYPSAEQSIYAPAWAPQLTDPFFLNQFKDPNSAINSGLKSTVLPYGNGRSYGDVCLNSSGVMLDISHLDNVISFDAERGVITAEAGITLRQILKIIVPHGWFLPVTPGTSWVTLGGAIANDVHGKNHHRAGTFGNHIESLELLRLGTTSTVSPTINAELFQATVAGLGLTGIILSATLKLIPIANHRIEGESIRFESLEEFFELSSASDAEFEYTVAWLDCLWSKGVRGHFMRGNHASKSNLPTLKPWSPRWELATVPCDVPGIFVKPWTMHCFNFAYYNKQRAKVAKINQSFEPFFYPLDIVSNWNKLYGANGFFQFQCVVPHAAGEPGIRAVIEAARLSGAGSFLAVLKEFGSAVSSPGMLSFPRPGYTLCLDFANQGAETIKLMQRLEQIVIKNGGALYAAKDALMSAESFASSYPRAAEFASYIEPGFSSDFWKRVYK